MFAMAFVVASLLRLASSPDAAQSVQQIVSLSSAQLAQTDWMLDVSVHGYNEASRHSASAGNHALDPFESYAWLNESCEMGASGILPGADRRASYVWHFTAKILERVGQDFEVLVDWDRAEAGAAASAPVVVQKSTFRARMHAGDRVVLDAVNPAVAPTCPIRSARLEAAIAAGRVASTPTGGGRARAGGGGGASGVGGGGVGGRGAGAGGTGVLGAGSTAAGSRDAAIADQRSLAAAMLDSARANLNAPFEAELWLVHTWPAGSESLKQTIGVGPGGWSFSFAPMRTLTARGVAMVSVSGVLRLELTNGKPSGVLVELNRHVQSNAPPAVDTFGGSAKRIAMPSPTDVTAFELPPLQQPALDLLAGHQFSLRLQLTPRTK
jgi:hypothetical protein